MQGRRILNSALDRGYCIALSPLRLECSLETQVALNPLQPGGAARHEHPDVRRRQAVHAARQPRAQRRLPAKAAAVGDGDGLHRVHHRRLRHRQRRRPRVRQARLHHGSPLGIGAGRLPHARAEALGEDVVVVVVGGRGVRARHGLPQQLEHAPSIPPRLVPSGRDFRLGSLKLVFRYVDKE